MPRAPILLLLLASAHAQAIPIRVLSRSSVEVRVDKQWDSVYVMGTLTDDRGTPITQAEVTLSLPGLRPRTAVTDGVGRFALALDASDLEALMRSGRRQGSSSVTFTITYGGDAQRGPSNASQTVDLSRETLQLQAVLVPPRVMKGEAPRILAVLRHGTRPVPDLRLRATVAEQTLTGTTGSDGRVVLSGLKPLPPGRSVVEVAFEGSERFNPLEVERKLSVILPTSVSLDPPRQSDDDPLKARVSGTLRGAGDPMPGIVVISLDGTAYAYARASIDGRFSATLDLTAEATRSGPRTAKLRAVYPPTEPWEVRSLSPARQIDIPPPPRVPVMAYLAPLIALGLALLVAALLRSGRLRAWWHRLRDRFRPAPLRRGSAAAGDEPLVEEVPPEAMPPARRPATRRDIRGFVWDSLTDRPTTGATIMLRTEGQVVAQAISDDRGAFALDDLPAGTHELAVIRRGFVTETISVRIPHSGYLSRCRIRFTPLRALTLAAYRKLVQECAQSPARFGQHTPRELEERMSERLWHRLPDLHEMTERFEELYFGGDDNVTEAGHHATETLVDRLREAGEPGAPEVGG